MQPIAYQLQLTEIPVGTACAGLKVATRCQVFSLLVARAQRQVTVLRDGLEAGHLEAELTDHVASFFQHPLLGEWRSRQDPQRFCKMSPKQMENGSGTLGTLGSIYRDAGTGRDPRSATRPRNWCNQSTALGNRLLLL